MRDTISLLGAVKKLPTTFGRYTLTERLAMGGMAELFLGEATGAHGFAKTVVIKRILPHLAADEQFTAMFISEAKITAKLDHPKIAQTFDLGIQEGQLFIAMEFIDGLDVLAVLRECAHRKVRIPAELSVYIVQEVLDALDFAHKQYGDDGKSLGVVHRDISPSNVLLSKRGDVKLVDFGIAHAAHEGSTQSGALKGKYGYMSPEQVTGEPLDARSDIFSVGILLAEMLMGRRLFAAPNELDVLLMVRDVQLERLEKFGGHIDAELQSIIRWALRRDRNDRFADAAAFRDLLDEWLFNNRHRVGAKNVSEVVEHLYADAEVRRNKSLQEADANEESKAPSEGVVPPPPKAEEKMQAPLSLDEEEEPSIRIETAEGVDIENELSLSEEGLDLELGLSGRDGVVQAPLDENDSSGIIVIENVDDTNISAEESEDFSIDLLIEDIGSGVTPATGQSPDPSAIDFDDSSVSDSKAPPRNQVRLPSAEEIADAATPQPPPLDDPDETPAKQGMLIDEPALAVLFRYTSSRATGLLDVSIGGIKKGIYFTQGIPEFVSSNIASELFGSYLVREGILSSGELDMSLAMMPHFGGKLGDTLVGLDLMKPLDVFRHLTSQVREKIIDVCTWSTGVYCWFPGRVNPREGFRLSIDPLEIYGAAAKRLPDEFLMDWLDNKGDVVFKKEKSAKIVPELFQVGPLLRETSETLNGEISLQELATGYTQDERCDRLRMLFLLVQTELASPVV